MPGEANLKDLAKKLFSLADGLIVLILVLLASQIFLMLGSYINIVKLWLIILFIIVESTMAILSSRVIFKETISTFLSNTVNLIISAFLLWIIGVDYSPEILFIIAVVMGITYILALLLSRQVEILRADFSSLDKLKVEKQGLNLKRYDDLLKDIKIILIVIDSLVVISWLAIKQINLSLILLGVATLLAQFLFWQVIVYSIRGLNWFLADAKIDFKLFMRSISWSLIIILIISALSLLAPVGHLNNFSDMIGDRLGNWEVDIELEPNVSGVEQKQEQPKQTGIKKSDANPDQEAELNVYMVLWFISLILLGLIIVIGIGLLIYYLVGKQIKEISYLPKSIASLISSLGDIVQGFFELVEGQLNQIKSTADENQESDQSQIKTEKNSAIQNRLDYHQDIIALCGELLNLLATKGIKRRKDETLREFFNNLASDFPVVEKELEQVQNIIEKSFYSQYNINYKTKERLKQLITDLENYDF
jgi:hypothetical protein